MSGLLPSSARGRWTCSGRDLRCWSQLSPPPAATRLPGRPARRRKSGTASRTTGSATPSGETPSSASCPTCGSTPATGACTSWRRTTTACRSGRLRASACSAWAARARGSGGLRDAISRALRGLPVLRARPVEVHLLLVLRDSAGNGAQPPQFARLPGIPPQDRRPDRGRELPGPPDHGEERGAGLVRR